jgi:hypothetical protein
MQATVISKVLKFRRWCGESIFTSLGNQRMQRTRPFYPCFFVSYQLKVISEKDADKKYDGILDVAMVDFYVIVSDNTTTVSELIFKYNIPKQFP